MAANDTDKQHPGQDSAEEKREQEKSGRTFYEKWKDPEQNNMGNDVSSEIKIANSGGQREEGYNKEWHMEEDSEKGDEELKKENQ